MIEKLHKVLTNRKVQVGTHIVAVLAMLAGIVTLDTNLVQSGIILHLLMDVIDLKSKVDS